MSYNIMTALNIGFFVLPFCIALSRYRHLDKALKVLCINFGITLLGESVAVYTALIFHNNMPVYALLGIADIVMTCIYFNYSIDCFRKNHVGYVLAGISVMAGILNFVFLQPLNSTNNNFTYWQGILVILLCIFSMIQYLRNSERNPYQSSIHFWISALLMIFWILSFLYWGLYEYLLEQFSGHQWVIDYMMVWICCATNICFSLILLLYRKKQERCTTIIF